MGECHTGYQKKKQDISETIVSGSMERIFLDKWEVLDGSEDLESLCVRNQHFIQNKELFGWHLFRGGVGQLGIDFHSLKKMMVAIAVGLRHGA